jgi:hypothetical protein
MNAANPGHDNGRIRQKLPKLSHSNLEVIPRLIGPVTTSAVLSSVGIFHDINAVGDPKTRREPKITDWLDLDESDSNQPEVRRRRYFVDCTAFGLEKDSSGCLKKAQTDLCAMFREQEDRFRREYNDKILVRHPFWQRFESKIPDVSDEECPSQVIFLESAHACIHDPCYKAISKSGIQGWLHDETIDMLFDLLERVLNSESYGIALLNVTFAQDLFTIGEHYMAALGQPKLAEQCYKSPHIDDNLLGKLIDKQYLVFPINDGYAARLDKDRLIQAQAFRRAGADSKGTHWSVMVVDCRATVVSARYLDSLHNNTANGMSRNMQVTECLLLGLQVLQAKYTSTALSNSPTRIPLYVDPNTPSQRYNNKSGHREGISACGPFIFLIVKEIVQYIVECHEEGKQDAIGDLSLLPDYVKKLDWDSKHTREVLRGMMDRERRTKEWLNGTSAWLDLLPQPGSLTGWQTWLKDRQLAQSYFWDPMLRPAELGPRFQSAVV